ncbi:hypothetical protein SARC_09025 [Sphaeroforma arctica JP610]|uniref:Uncharacterized protein n=1 Tax=Sphaeroforma arctica JP610 TaxID=667725 RepID=A0A0L0FP25_9EUKA|nr:hypothetical protein SARC_09025 [Sphaeroforma arctica JP610]KNC78552.1 hypothetical protein SARC_09025 [Sphaeroforma arctica JP610]|eukprot:XP_014152454.1 hypothetical protein SARC_09025 [Sphaeroforma arctica JP610]
MCTPTRDIYNVQNQSPQTFKSALRKLVNSDTWPSDGLLDPVNLMQIGTLGTFSFVKDHLPSSYIASIQKRYPPALKMGQTEKSLTKRTSSYVLFLKEQ